MTKMIFLNKKPNPLCPKTHTWWVAKSLTIKFLNPPESNWSDDMVFPNPKKTSKSLHVDHSTSITPLNKKISSQYGWGATGKTPHIPPPDWLVWPKK